MTPIGWSLIGSKRRLHMEADNEEHITAWLLGLAHLLAKSNKKVYDWNDPKKTPKDMASELLSSPASRMKSNREKRFSILADKSAAPHSSPASRQVHAKNMSVSPSHEDREAALHAMRTGVEVIIHHSPTRNEKAKLFYAGPGGKHGPFGSVYWCKPRTTKTNPRQCIPLHRLRDFISKVCKRIGVVMERNRNFLGRFLPTSFHSLGTPFHMRVYIPTLSIIRQDSQRLLKTQGLRTLKRPG